jgi:hypothetical protein
MNTLIEVAKNSELDEPWKSHNSAMYEFTEPENDSV